MYLPRIEQAKRIYSSLDRLHEVDCALAKLFDQEVFLSDADSMLPRAYAE